ncbi:trehalase-like domain-containing protein [Chloroflexota bacterium]
MVYKPVSDYGIIGNMVSAALVATDGFIDWCCLPRFDSPSIFAAILDDKKGGRFGIEPRSQYESNQSYLDDTNPLQTVFRLCNSERWPFSPYDGCGKHCRCTRAFTLGEKPYY